jgi:hypothetical protein
MKGRTANCRAETCPAIEDLHGVFHSARRWAVGGDSSVSESDIGPEAPPISLSPASHEKPHIRRAIGASLVTIRGRPISRPLYHAGISPICGTEETPCAHKWNWSLATVIRQFGEWRINRRDRRNRGRRRPGQIQGAGEPTRRPNRALQIALVTAGKSVRMTNATFPCIPSNAAFHGFTVRVAIRARRFQDGRTVPLQGGEPVLSSRSGARPAQCSPTGSAWPDHHPHQNCPRPQWRRNGASQRLGDHEQRLAGASCVSAHPARRSQYWM